MKLSYAVDDVVSNFIITEIYRDDQTGRPRAKMRCLSCSTERDVRLNNLSSARSGKSSLRCAYCFRQAASMNAVNVAVAQALYVYRANAIRKNREWNLTDSQFKDLSLMDCFFCDKSPELKEGPYNGSYPSQINGIDRLDSAQGYSIENCVACCSGCNRSKMDRSVEEFLLWAKRISEAKPWLKT